MDECLFSAYRVTDFELFHGLLFWHFLLISQIALHSNYHQI